MFVESFYFLVREIWSVKVFGQPQGERFFPDESDLQRIAT